MNSTLERLTRRAVRERDRNAGCDYPTSLNYWLKIARDCEFMDSVSALADELKRASQTRTSTGEPDTTIMLAAMSAVRDAIIAYEEMKP